MAPTHLILFERQRESIQRQIKNVSESCDVSPWEVFLIVVDLRSEFGREVALHFHAHFTIDAKIRAAEIRGEPPGLTVPLVGDGGLEILRTYVPELESQVLTRPPQTVAMLVVDEFDHPIIAIGRLFDARLALS